MPPRAKRLPTLSGNRHTFAHTKLTDLGMTPIIRSRNCILTKTSSYFAQLTTRLSMRTMAQLIQPQTLISMRERHEKRAKRRNELDTTIRKYVAQRYEREDQVLFEQVDLYGPSVDSMFVECRSRVGLTLASLSSCSASRWRRPATCHRMSLQMATSLRAPRRPYCIRIGGATPCWSGGRAKESRPCSSTSVNSTVLGCSETINTQVKRRNCMTSRPWIAFPSVWICVNTRSGPTVPRPPPREVKRPARSLVRPRSPPGERLRSTSPARSAESAADERSRWKISAFLFQPAQFYSRSMVSTKSPTSSSVKR